MTLAKEAVDLAVRKSLEDLNTLLAFIDETDDLDDRIKHIRRSRELLEELEANLIRLRSGHP